MPKFEEDGIMLRDRIRLGVNDESCDSYRTIVMKQSGSGKVPIYKQIKSPVLQVWGWIPIIKMKFIMGIHILILYDLSWHDFIVCNS